MNLYESSFVKGISVHGVEKFLVQLPEENPWGFVLADDDQTWAGGFGSGLQEWELITPDQVPTSERERLEFLLDS